MQEDAGRRRKTEEEADTQQRETETESCGFGKVGE